MNLKSFFAVAVLSTALPSQSYAQYDSISALIDVTSQAEVTNTTAADVSAIAIEPTLEPQQPVYTTDDHKKLAQEFIKKGLYNKALFHIDALQATEEELFATFLKATVLAQQGQFEKAFDLYDHTTGFNSPFKEASQDAQAELALKLAWVAAHQNNLQQAGYWLNRYNPHKETGHLEDMREQLEDTINIKKLEKFDNAPKGKPLKVALLLPLSGIHQNMGQNMLEAAQLALFQQPNQNVLLYPHDTQSTETGARLAAQKAISDRAHIILGPLTAANTRAIESFAESADMPVISFSSDSTLANRDLHIFGHNNGIQGSLAAKMIADSDVSISAVLAPNNDYGINMTQTFTDQALALGVSVSQVVYFDPNSNDQSQQLKQLAQEERALQLLKDEKAMLEREFKLVGAAMSDASLTRLESLETLSPQPMVDFGALYLPVSSNKLPLIASQLAFYDMDNSHIQLVGSALWHNKSLYTNKGEYIKGSLYPAPASALLTVLEKDFKTHYQKDMAPMSSLAYDAVKMVTQAYVYSGYRPNRIQDEFYRDGGYLLSNGPTKLFRGGLTERLYDTNEVRTYSHITRLSAPMAFPPSLPNPLDPRERSGLDSFFNPWGF